MNQPGREEKQQTLLVQALPTVTTSDGQTGTPSSGASGQGKDLPQGNPSDQEKPSSTSRESSTTPDAASRQAEATRTQRGTSRAGDKDSTTSRPQASCPPDRCADAMRRSLNAILPNSKGHPNGGWE